MIFEKKKNYFFRLITQETKLCIEQTQRNQKNKIEISTFVESYYMAVNETTNLT